jgi:hypothetical protein
VRFIFSFFHFDFSMGLFVLMNVFVEVMKISSLKVERHSSLVQCICSGDQ